MKYNNVNDNLKNYRKDFVNFTEDKIKKLNFHNSDKMFTIHYYPMIIIFENYSENNYPNEYLQTINNEISNNEISNNEISNNEILNNKIINNDIVRNFEQNIIVIDNFYNNPDEIRNYALTLTYEMPENHGAVGYRCQSGRKIQDGTKELFEKLLHKSIPDGNNIGEWNYTTNGCFQWCNASVPIVYHSDTQQYAAILYLTPDTPPQCGTSIYRHK